MHSPLDRHGDRKASPAQAENTCQVKLGNSLTSNGGKAGKLEVPCKYGAVRQQCGDYFVRLTPGNVYINRYFINTVWLEVRTKDGREWRGRTSTDQPSLPSLQFINDAGDVREAFQMKQPSDYETDDLFDFTKTENDITATVKDGSFSVTFGPFDPTGSKHRNVGLTFTCTRDDSPPEFPIQICGGEDPKDVQYMAEELGFKPNDKFKPHMRDQTYYYAIFTDPDLDQTPDTMLNVCPDGAKRKEAIENCYMILYSKPHRKCATKYSCELIDVFANCVKFVCSDYKDEVACQAVAEAIDMCRNFPGLSDRILEAKCYTGFIVLDSNSTVYKN
nr:hypothetical protein BaRGS_020559 [Batillaria attramentaria]